MVAFGFAAPWLGPAELAKEIIAGRHPMHNSGDPIAVTVLFEKRSAIYALVRAAKNGW